MSWFVPFKLTILPLASLTGLQTDLNVFSGLLGIQILNLISNGMPIVLTILTEFITNSKSSG